jgi:hypothetical protein
VAGLPRSRAHGAARWISPGKALIQLLAMKQDVSGGDARFSTDSALGRLDEDLL